MQVQTQSASTPTSSPKGVSGVADVAHDSLQLAVASAANLVSEPAVFLSGLAQDIAEASGRLAASRSPIDVLAVQQSYAMARSKAWLDSAMRCFERCVADPASSQQELGRFALPE